MEIQNVTMFKNMVNLFNITQNINHNVWINSLISGQMGTATHVLVVQPQKELLRGVA